MWAKIPLPNYFYISFSDSLTLVKKSHGGTDLGKYIKSVSSRREMAKFLGETVYSSTRGSTII